MGAASLLLVIICGLAFAGGALLLSTIITPWTRNSQKGEAYECGVETKGQSWIQFSVDYYLFALIFLIFDVELVFFYPWAVVVKSVGVVALVEIVIFLFILFLGFVYAHKKGALKWQ